MSARPVSPTLASCMEAMWQVAELARVLCGDRALLYQLTPETPDSEAQTEACAKAMGAPPFVSFTF